MLSSLMHSQFVSIIFPRSYSIEKKSFRRSYSFFYDLKCHRYYTSSRVVRSTTFFFVLFQPYRELKIYIFCDFSQVLEILMKTQYFVTPCYFSHNNKKRFPMHFLFYYIVLYLFLSSFDSSVVKFIVVSRGIVDDGLYLQSDITLRLYAAVVDSYASAAAVETFLLRLMSSASVENFFCLRVHYAAAG